MKALCRTILYLSFALTACTAGDPRGIADKRSDFKSFLPMKASPERDGLKAVKPFFRSADRSQIIRAIDHACLGGAQGHKSGSSVYNERTGQGYYVNCNPENRQLLNGYVPVDAKREPHSR